MARPCQRVTGDGCRKVDDLAAQTRSGSGLPQPGGDHDNPTIDRPATSIPATSIPARAQAKKTPSGRRKQQRAFEAAYALTPEQFRAWWNLTEAQHAAIEAGEIVPCVAHPDDFDRRRFSDDELEEMERRCNTCPARQRCDEYKASGVVVTGFLAGAACERVC